MDGGRAPSAGLSAARAGEEGRDPAAMDKGGERERDLPDPGLGFWADGFACRGLLRREGTGNRGKTTRSRSRSIDRGKVEENGRIRGEIGRAHV